MARRKLAEVMHYLRHLTNSENDSGLSDAALLERYVRHRDEAAFELLLWRHGVLVFNVCRRLLSSEQDAEDAFQATFLAFVRKAHVIAHRDAVSSWLYKVAYRIALEARERTGKIAAREKRGGESLAVQSPADPMWSDLHPILDEELYRLPERLRRPLILCYLEGKSNGEAARELGCRLGTIYSRLSRGREMLRRRLLRRGVTLSVATLAAALAENAAEAAPAIPMVRSAIAAARSFAGLPSGGPISPRATMLAEGVLRHMRVIKLKMVALMMFVVGALAAGGVLSHGLTAAPQPEAKAEDPPPQQKKAGKPDAKPIAVTVVKPTPGGLARTTRQGGEVIAAQQQRLVPLISGSIKEVNVDLGDPVKKGQTLIVLDAPLVRKELEQAMAAVKMAEAQAEEAEALVTTAQADVEIAKVALANAERLVRTAVKPPSEAAAAKADVQVKMGKLAHARAALKTARAHVDASRLAADKARIQESFTRLTAAFDGVVTRRTADPGNFVQPSDSRLLVPLLTVQSLDPLRLVVRLPSEYAPRISRGDPVELTLRDPYFRISGLKVTRFNSALDSEQRTMRVEIDLPNSDGHLLPGMFGAVTIHFKKAPAGTLVVPASCLRGTYNADSFNAWVYVVRDGKAYRTQVTPGHIGDDEAEIVQGIKSSDLIVTEAAQLKLEGKVVPVEVKKVP